MINQHCFGLMMIYSVFYRNSRAVRIGGVRYVPGHKPFLPNRGGRQSLLHPIIEVSVMNRATIYAGIFLAALMFGGGSSGFAVEPSSTDIVGGRGGTPFA